MEKEKIDKMVRVDFCNNKEFRDKLYEIHKIFSKIADKEEEIKKEEKEE